MSEATANQRRHGHVTPNADGYLARCGGPKICKVCMQELAALKQPISTDPLILSSPARIYLIVGDECPRDAKFSELAEVTWCEDDLDGGIEYVRADLKARARLGNAVVMPRRMTADDFREYHDASWRVELAEVSNRLLDEVARLNPSRGVAEVLPHWEPCNPGCDPDFNGQRSRECAQLCHNARSALAKSDQCDGVQIGACACGRTDPHNNTFACLKAAADKSKCEGVVVPMELRELLERIDKAHCSGMSIYPELQQIRALLNGGRS